MILNIPYKFNPMPYYKATTPPTPPAPDYQNMPMTFECVSGSVGVLLPLLRYVNTEPSSTWAGSNSPISSMYYKKTGDSQWTDWKAQGFTAVILNEGQQLQLSGINGGILSRSWGNYYNAFAYSGTGKVALKGNMSSIFDSSVTNIYLNNFFYCDYGNMRQYLVDAGHFLIPYQFNGNQAGNLFHGARALQRGPLLLSKNYQNNLYNWVYGDCQKLIACEFCFEYSSSWSFGSSFYQVNTTGIYIKPKNTYLPSKGRDTIPSNWTVLNRDNGYLYYAEAKNGHAVGDPYEGDDPYQWYWSKHRS